MDDMSPEYKLTTASGVDCDLLLACLTANKSSELHPLRDKLFFICDSNSDLFRKACLNLSDLRKQWNGATILSKSVLVILLESESSVKNSRKRTKAAYPVIMTDMGPILVQRDYSALGQVVPQEDSEYTKYIDTVKNKGITIRVERNLLMTHRSARPSQNDPIFLFSSSQLHRATFRNSIAALKEVNYDEFERLRERGNIGPGQSRLLLTEIGQSLVYDNTPEIPSKLLTNLLAHGDDNQQMRQTIELLFSQIIVVSLTVVHFSSVETIRISTDVSEVTIVYFLTPFGAIRIYEHTLEKLYDQFVKALIAHGRHLIFSKEDYIKFHEDSNMDMS
jgi:hypothetical protein